MNQKKCPLTIALLASTLGVLPMAAHASVAATSQANTQTQAGGIGNSSSFTLTARDQDKQVTANMQVSDNAATPADPGVEPAMPGNATAADEVADHRPDIDRVDRDRPDVDRADIDRPDVDRADIDRPDVDRPDVDRPDVDRPDIERPEMDR
ncbi:MAG: hypothetical protein ACYCRH_12745 [Acidiferrobacteraceae bacterium]